MAVPKAPVYEYHCLTRREHDVGRAWEGDGRADRYRYPRACRLLRITNSIFVSLPRIPDIMRLRVTASTTSGIRFVPVLAHAMCR